MKKLFLTILVVILTISILTACGNNNNSEADDNESESATTSESEFQPETDSENNPPDRNNSADSDGSTAKFNPTVVISSELILPEEATRILGDEIDVEYVDEVDSMSLASNNTSFKSKEDFMYYMTIWIYQTSTLDTTYPNQKAILELGGIANFNDTQYEGSVGKEGAVILEGLGDWAIINNDVVEIAYGDYYIYMTIKTTLSNIELTDEEYIEKLTDAGTIAFGRLEEIVNQ